jgi:hypothetical protein
MKLKRIAAIAIALICVPAYADILIQSSMRSVTGDGCGNFAGNWKGEGLVSNYCKYTGTATVTPAGEVNTYNIDVDLHSMTFMCPPDSKSRLVASCKNGKIRITSKNADLDGTTDGTKVNLKGTIILDSGTRLTLNYLNLSR